MRPSPLLYALPMLSLLFAAGCHRQAIDDRANQKVTQVLARAERAAVYPSCADHAPIGPGCGLYMKRASTEEFRILFRDAKCQGRAAEDCQALYQRAIDAWLAQRYISADWRAVALTCDANPGRCDDPAAYELLLLDSHNFHVRDAAARAENEIELGRRAAHRRDAREGVATLTAAVGTAALLTLGAPKCRTYPSVFEGVTTTICDP